MKWVMRERPMIDRIACPWLIRRFVKADAVFLYVPTEKVFEVAAATGGYHTTFQAQNHSAMSASFARLTHS